MNELIKSLEQEQLKNEVPNFGPGDTVKVHVRIVEVTRKGKVRRAKINYLRTRTGKAAKVKEARTKR